MRPILLTILFLLLAVPARAQEAAERPNLVVFIADDLGATDVGPYGNPVVRTPNLDRLAGESMRFTSAYASSPTCAPSRSTLYTGLMPFRNGAHGNHSGVKEGTRSLVHELEEAGYRVALAGKLHVGPREVFPFEYVAETNVPEPGFEQNPGLHYDLQMEPVDAWLADQSGDRPFALVVADHSPHVVWPAEPAYDPDSVDVPARHIDTPAYRHARTRYYTDITKMDANLGLLLESLERHGLADETLVLFTADQGPQWPFAKWSLYEEGVRVPLLVRWPGAVAPGTTTNALVSLADVLPTLVEAAGSTPPQEIDGKSFLPVLRGRATSHRDAVFATHTGDGQMNRSPARMLRTERFKYILNLAPEILYTTHMDRATDHDGGREYWDSWRKRSFEVEHAAATLWRYHNRPAEELYDLEVDPQERHNLAGAPAYAPLLETFRERMAAWREQQGDAETGPEELPPPQPGRRTPVAPYVF